MQKLSKHFLHTSFYSFNICKIYKRRKEEIDLINSLVWICFYFEAPRFRFDSNYERNAFDDDSMGWMSLDLYPVHLEDLNTMVFSVAN